jgi:hypothetical protein
MDIVAKRYNEKFRYRWDRIIDFLKLHYVLSARNDSEFWIENRAAGSIPDSLSEKLELWRHRAPWLADFDYQDEIFSAASYQYVLYGMGFESGVRHGTRHQVKADTAMRLFVQNNEQANRVVGQLPTNRNLLNAIAQRDARQESGT